MLAEVAHERVDKDGAGALGNGVARAENPCSPGIVALARRSNGKRNESVHDREPVLSFSDPCQAVPHQCDDLIGVVATQCQNDTDVQPQGQEPWSRHLKRSRGLIDEAIRTIVIPVRERNPREPACRVADSPRHRQCQEQLSAFREPVPGRVHISGGVFDMSAYPRAKRDGVEVSSTACLLHGAGGARARLLEIAMRVRRCRCAKQRPDPGRGRKRGQAQDLLVPSHPFGGVAANEPEEQQRHRDGGGLVAAAVPDEPRQRGAVGLEIFPHTIKPLDLPRSDQAVRSEGRFTPAVADDRLQRGVMLTSGSEFEGRVRTDGLEHVVQGTCGDPGRLRSQQQALVDQASHRIECVVAAGRRAVTSSKDVRHGVDREQSRQCAQAAEGALLFRIEQPVTPGDGRVHRLLALGKIARSGCRQQDVLREAAEQVPWRQHFDPRRGQFECKRQGIELATDGGNGRTVRGCESKVGTHVAHPFDEQADRRHAREISQRHLL